MKPAARRPASDALLRVLPTTLPVLALDGDCSATVTLRLMPAFRGRTVRTMEVGGVYCLAPGAETGSGGISPPVAIAFIRK